MPFKKEEIEDFKKFKNKAFSFEEAVFYEAGKFGSLKTILASTPL